MSPQRCYFIFSYPWSSLPWNRQLLEFDCFHSKMWKHSWLSFHQPLYANNKRCCLVFPFLLPSLPARMRDSMKVLFNPESTGDFIVSIPKSRGGLFVCLPDKALSDNLVITIIGTVQQQLVCSSPVLAALPTPSSPSGGESRCLHHQFILILTTSGILIFILTTPVSFILILPTPVSFILILTRPWNSHI